MNKSVASVLSKNETQGGTKEVENTAIIATPSLEVRFSREAFDDLRRVKREFKQDILPEIKRRKSFQKGGKRKLRRGGVHKQEEVMPLSSPMGRFLKSFERSGGYDRRNRNGGNKRKVSSATAEIQQPNVLISTTPILATAAAVIAATDPFGFVRTEITPQPIQPVYKMISVSVVALFELEQPMLMIQKARHKSKPGLPGGTIEDGYSIIDTAIKEFKEETGGSHKRPRLDGFSEEQYFGINIEKYGPRAIGDFLLARAGYGEKGAVVFVKVPFTEAANVMTGQISEDESIEWIELWSLDKVVTEADAGRLLANSVEALKIFLAEYPNLLS